MAHEAIDLDTLIDLLEEAASRLRRIRDVVGGTVGVHRQVAVAAPASDAAAPDPEARPRFAADTVPINPNGRGRSFPIAQEQAPVRHASFRSLSPKSSALSPPGERP